MLHPGISGLKKPAPVIQMWVVFVHLVHSWGETNSKDRGPCHQPYGQLVPILARQSTGGLLSTLTHTQRVPGRQLLPVNTSPHNKGSHIYKCRHLNRCEIGRPSQSQGGEESLIPWWPPEVVMLFTQCLICTRAKSRHLQARQFIIPAPLGLPHKLWK